jgi:colicin import membrane protein
MSTVSTSRPAKRPPDDSDPFRYGWRYKSVRGPDGTEVLDQVPLTLEDVLFPETGDFIVQTDLHDTDSSYLKHVFNSRLAGDPQAVAVSDCRVDWNLAGVRPLGPDIAVFFGIKRRKDWATLDVAAEGARPALVVEVTSTGTRQNDLDIKPGFYHRAGVPLYVIADVLEEDEETRHVELIGYRHAPEGYQRIAPDARGWIWLEPLGLWLGVVQDPVLGCDRLACFDAQTGGEIGDYQAISQALEAATAAQAQAEARAEAEARRAGVEANAREQAEAKAQSEARAREQAEAKAQSEAKAREQAEAKAQSEARAREQAEARVLAEAGARTQAETRAQAEAQRAEAEATARHQAEAKIRELEAAIRRLGHGS